MKEKWKKLLNAIQEENKKARSAWKRGVCDYAMDFVDFLEEENPEKVTREVLLNGARDWTDFSYGGCSLIYDGDICDRLCNDTEKKRTRNGELRPNREEEWLDVQARALLQASGLVVRLARTIEE